MRQNHKKKKQQLTDGETFAFKTFKDVERAINPDPDNVASTKVPLDDRRKSFRRQHTGNNDKSKDAIFGRNRRELVNNGYLIVENDIYSLGNMATS